MLNFKSLQNLTKHLGLTKSELDSLLQNIDSHYRTFSVPKKGTDETRPVIAPTKELMQVQKRVLKLLQRVQLHPCAHGAVKGRSHVSNAQMHVNNCCVYSLDFRKFFPSIKSRQIRKLFEERLKCSPKVSSVLTRLTTHKFALVTGAPTSPALANIYCYPLDCKLAHLAKQNGIIYTRFIDDLTFSGNNIPDEFQRAVKDVVRGFGVPLNPAKEKLTTPSEEQSVTGLNVNKKKIKVPRSFKRNLRAQIHQYKEKRNQLTPKQRKKKRSSINGKVNYIKMIEPE